MSEEPQSEPEAPVIAPRRFALLPFDAIKWTATGEYLVKASFR